MEQAETALRELQGLSELPPYRNIFERHRQRRVLNSWLQRAGYVTPGVATVQIKGRQGSVAVKIFEAAASTVPDLERQQHQV
jgi:hypothetical protein